MTDLPLADLDAFVAVAAERSFRAAARKRGVSPSSLSEALRRLEERLGVRLLNRTTRSVTATEAGERLLERLSPAMTDIQGALDAISDVADRPTGRLRLNVPTVAAMTFLSDTVNRFLRQHPGILLEVIAEDSFIDVLAKGFDAGVRYDERLERDMIAVPIGPRRQRFVTAASPAYLAEYGRPLHPRDLLDHRCVVHRFSSGAIPQWEYERDGEVITLQPTACFICNTLALQVGAAVGGLGIVTTFEDFLRPALENGSLVPLLEDWLPPFSGPFLYYSSHRHVPPPLRAFIDFLRAEQRRTTTTHR